MSYATTRLPDGRLVYLGPFNRDQAPHLECANCGGAITVGQRFHYLVGYQLAVDEYGQLAFLGHTDFPKDSVSPRYIHDDCTAEYSHDHITKEPCGRNEDDFEDACEACGVPVPNSQKYCEFCNSKLAGLGP